MSKRVAIVSGASSLLGEAICKRLSNEGFLVAQMSRGSPSYPCDVRNPSECDLQVRKVVADLGTITTLVNCAGVNSDRLLLRSTPEDFSSVYATNVIGAMNLTRSCIKHGGMLKERKGCIVNIGSIVGVYGNGGQTAYAASKAALIGASKSIAKEYAPVNIRCNVLCPGLIAGTAMWRNLSDGQRDKIVGGSLLGRCASVEEISDAAFFLANNTYVNGQALVMDGGQ